MLVKTCVADLPATAVHGDERRILSGGFRRIEVAGELDAVMLAVLKASLHVEFQGLRECIGHGNQHHRNQHEDDKSSSRIHVSSFETPSTIGRIALTIAKGPNY